MWSLLREAGDTLGGKPFYPSVTFDWQIHHLSKLLHADLKSPLISGPVFIKLLKDNI